MAASQHGGRGPGRTQENSRHPVRPGTAGTAHITLLGVSWPLPMACNTSWPGSGRLVTFQGGTRFPEPALHGTLTPTDLQSPATPSVVYPGLYLCFPFILLLCGVATYRKAHSVSDHADKGVRASRHHRGQNWTLPLPPGLAYPSPPSCRQRRSLLIFAISFF